MKNYFDKSKSWNYITACVFVIFSFLLVKEASVMLWQFDIFKWKHIAGFFKFVFSGRIFSSLKYMSFIVMLAGIIIITYNAVIISMCIDFNGIINKYKGDKSKDGDKKTDELSENVANSENNKTVEAEKVQKVENASEITPKNINVAPPKPEDKFVIYNNKKVENTPVEEVANEVVELKPEQKVEVEPVVKEEQHLNNTEFSEDEERAKLQAKIKEVMEKMNKKNDAQNPKDTKEKILSPVNFSNNTPKLNMNFKNITEDENDLMEHKLISAGFKLLSEIRIGSTGIDYLGIAKDKLTVVQFDNSKGNWLASEDKVEGNDYPVWFAETENKISPVARAIEARENIQRILGNSIAKPVETVACLLNSNVINCDEVAPLWENSGVKVVRLLGNDELDDGIKSLDALFPENSQQEPEETELNTIISILENAEIPE